MQGMRLTAIGRVKKMLEQWTEKRAETKKYLYATASLPSGTMGPRDF